MIIILSPTKIFRDYPNGQLLSYQALLFEAQTERLIARLKGYSVSDLEKLMKASTDIAACNYERFQRFDVPDARGYHAADYFYGEAFKALDAPTLSEAGRKYLGAHLKILSGLYGCLDAMSVIQPYRLEMGTKFSKKKGDQLTAFWKPYLTSHIREAIAASEGDKVLINLASDEYSKALNLKELAKDYKVITPQFKVNVKGEYKVVGMYAKKARGLMTRYICNNNIQSLEDIKAFQEEGYQFAEDLSDDSSWVFVKE